MASELAPITFTAKSLRIRRAACEGEWTVVCMFHVVFCGLFAHAVSCRLPFSLSLNFSLSSNFSLSLIDLHKLDAIENDIGKINKRSVRFPETH